MINNVFLKKCLVGKVSASAQFDVTTTRSWTTGQSYGGTLQIAAGRKQKITGYIPRVSTLGSLKYKVYMDGYESNYWYEYVSLPSTYLPARSHVHFVAEDI